jgi:hypothetical protein
VRIDVQRERLVSGGSRQPQRDLSNQAASDDGNAASNVGVGQANRVQRHGGDGRDRRTLEWYAIRHTDAEVGRHGNELGMTRGGPRARHSITLPETSLDRLHGRVGPVPSGASDDLPDEVWPLASLAEERLLGESHARSLGPRADLAGSLLLKHLSHRSAT